jgi:hypothetical protein
MYKTNLEVELSCPAHPDFSPDMEDASNCRCCRAMGHVQQWIKMARNMSNAILNGLYHPKEDVAIETPRVEEIADIAPEPPPAEEPATEKVPVRTVRRKAGGR